MKSSFEKNPFRKLPDGTITKVYPFHVSFEGLESFILCRDDSDYDAIVKIICVSARRKNVILVIYAVVSNHAHCIVLAESQASAESFAEDVKKIISMRCSYKQTGTSVMKRSDAKAIYLDTEYYLRNAIAYVVRNAMDNGASSIQEYKWTGYRAVFCKGRISLKALPRRVSDLSKQERRNIMHTGDKLDDVPWLLNEDEELEPVSICDWRYVEEAFKNDQSFFMRLIGVVNTAEMKSKLISAPRIKRKDAELMASVNELSQRWFSKNVNELTLEKKARLMTYVSHSFKSDPSQLARTFEISRESVVHLLSMEQH